MVDIYEISKLTFFKLKEKLENLKPDKLYEIKSKLDDLYYNDGTSPFSDQQYDLLIDILNEECTNLETKVGTKIRDGDNIVKLPYFLGSLDKIKDKDENKLNRWLEKYNKDKYYIMPKLDGCSCLLTYDNGSISLFTRGDGKEGSDITHILPYINHNLSTVEKNINELIHNVSNFNPVFAVRGELIIPIETFRVKYSKDNSNARNMVTGLIGAKTLRKGMEDIHFVAYELIQFRDNSEQIQVLLQLPFLRCTLEFETAEYISTERKLNISMLKEYLAKFKKSSKYELDGIVVVFNTSFKRNESGNPKHTFAFKSDDFTESIETVVEEVQWEASKHNVLIPTIKIKQVNISGVNINYASAYNARYIYDNKIGKGSIVKITRSGDVIPKIVEVVKCNEEADMPDVDYSWSESGVDIVVEDNDTSKIKVIAGFFQGLGVKSVSEKTVEKLYNDGHNTILKILKLKPDDISKIDGFQKTLADKVYTNIHTGLQNSTLAEILGSSSIVKLFGTRKFKTLLDAIPDLLKIYKTKSRPDLIILICNVEGFSTLSAEKLVDNLERYDKFVNEIKEFTMRKVGICEPKKLKTKLKIDVSGKTFVFSGFRDGDLEKIVENTGGKITSSVSKKTNYVVVSDLDSNSSKVDKARTLGVSIITKDELI